MKKSLNLCGGISSVVVAGVALSLVAPVGGGNVYAEAPTLTSSKVSGATEIGMNTTGKVSIPDAPTNDREGVAKIVVPSSGWVDINLDYTKAMSYQVYLYDSNFNYLTDQEMKSSKTNGVRSGSLAFQNQIMKAGTYYLYFESNSLNWDGNVFCGADINVSYTFTGISHDAGLDTYDNDSISKAVELPFDSNQSTGVSGVAEWYTFNTSDKEDYYKITVATAGSYDLKATASKGITVSLYDSASNKLNSYGGVIKKSVNETVSLSKGVYYIDLASGTYSNTYDFSLSLQSEGSGSTDSGSGSGSSGGESGSGSTDSGSGSGSSGGESGSGSTDSGSGSGSSGSGSSSASTGSGSGSGSTDSGSGSASSGNGSGIADGGAGAASSGNGSGAATIPAGQTYSTEWVNGKWYNADGSQTYEPTLEWKSDSTGWWVEDSNGWYPTSSWQKIDGYWYYFKSNGYMAAGEYYDGYWFNSDGTWDDTYLLSWKSNSTGWWVEDISGWWPSSSWLKINDSWYYFDGSGYMVTDQYVDGYWLGSDGACW